MNLPVVNMKQTGQNITMLREQRGISVRQLQRMMGFATPQAIYKWQHGESLPTVDNLVALSAIFSGPIDAILITGSAASHIHFEARTSILALSFSFADGSLMFTFNQPDEITQFHVQCLCNSPERINICIFAPGFNHSQMASCYAG